MHWKNTLPVLAAIILCFTIGCKSSKEEEKNNEKYEYADEQDGLNEAIKQEFQMTQDPALGYVPVERLAVAYKYQKNLIASRQFRTDAFSWQERGPNNIGGRTRAFIVDSRDATGNTIFAAGVSGGIWKATNFKTTPLWTPVSDNMGSLAVCAMAQDPSSPAVMYAGTGEGWFTSNGVRGNGIWKSLDGGSTWSQIPSTDSTTSTSSHNFDYIQDIVVNSAGVVFATGRPSKFCNTGGVYRSSNGGTSWSRVIGTLTAQTCDSAYNYYGADLELASNGDVYATTGFFNNGQINQLGRIWRSSALVNGANVGTTGTWTDITPAGTWQRIEIAVAPSNPAFIYALLQGTGNGIGAIKKSSDFGVTWTDLAIPVWCNQGATSNDFTNGQAWFDLIVNVDPNDPNTVYIGGIDLFKSVNGGSTWSQISQWYANCTSLPAVHADQHNIQFIGSSSTSIIASNDGGIYYSPDAGATWSFNLGLNADGTREVFSTKNTGYDVTQFYACAIHPTLPNYFLAGAQDNGSLRFSTAGVNEITGASGGDGGFCHIDQTDGSIQITSYVHNNFFYSRNNGVNFSRIDFNNNGQFINPSDYDNVLKVLYSGNQAGQLGVMRNIPGPGVPNFISVPITSLSNRVISAVKVDPTVAVGGTIWVAGYDTTGATRPNVVKIGNANTTSPTLLSTSVMPPSIPAGAYISSIDVDPANGNHILVTLSNYGVISVLESTDGTTFNNVEGNLPDVPVRWGMFVPATASVNGTAPGGILLATELGVWYTPQTSGTSTNWVPQNTGLPNVRTDMLKFRASDNLLAVATHGRGLFTTTLTAIATGIPTVLNTKNFIDYTTTVSKEQLFVKVGNLSTTTMNIRLFDVNGKLVYNANTSYSNQTIPIAALASGSYIIKIYGNKNEQFTKQFVK